jgi:hypothetical protein
MVDGEVYQVHSESEIKNECFSELFEFVLFQLTVLNNTECVVGKNNASVDSIA